MNPNASLSKDGRTLTIRAGGQRHEAGHGLGRRRDDRRPHPPTFRKRGGRKRLVAPDGAEWAPPRRVDNAMVEALARAFRWRKMLDEGVHATIDDLAKAKRLTPSYVSGILRLTLLAPEIVETTLDGRQPVELQIYHLLEGLPLESSRQFDRGSQ